MTTLRSAADILHDFRVSTSSSAPGRYYAICPQCSHKRKKVNQKLKCLGVTIDGQGVRIGCNHCQWSGGGFYRAAPAAVDSVALDRAKAKAVEVESQKKTLWLWSQRQPPSRSIVETYLRKCRRYTGPLPATIGFLPARGEHLPAMISAFGMARETLPGELVIDDEAVTGIHITKLKPDGSDKAGTEADKLTIGIANTSPIWLAPINDGMGLAITEGIEDGLSVHAATGLGSWAAGTAGRLPAMADAVPDYVETVTILVDGDDSGEKNSTELARRLVARGIEVLMVRPGGDA